MQYTHKKNSALVRVLFVTFIALGFIVAFIPFKDSLRTIMSVVGVACIAIGMTIFMKYESTVYSIVINARETDYDFFINKAVGRRGSYICYFLVSDALKVVKYDGTDSKATISNEYNGIAFHEYVHNMNSTDRFAIIFLLNGKYDALIVELSPEALSQLEHFISCAKAVNERHTEILGYGSEDDEQDAPNEADATTAEAEAIEVSIVDVEATDAPVADDIADTKEE